MYEDYAKKRDELGLTDYRVSKDTGVPLLAGDIIDDESKLDLMPFLTPEMKETIMRRKADVDMSRFGNVPNKTTIEDDVA